MMIKAAINGGRSKVEHSAVPVSPHEQASDASACLKAGASAVHLHIRSIAGEESLRPDDVARTLTTVLSVCSRAEIGVSTGAWILPDTEKRFQAVTAWKVLPGFASVNFIEEGAAELAELLLSKGVEVEAGLSDGHAAELLLKSHLAHRCFRVLLEPQEQDMASALATVNEIERLLDTGAVEVPRVLHGTEATTWPMMDEAINRGYHVRVGLEDTLVLSNGTVARNKKELVAEAVRRVRR
jgi:uncharacterized protein (DUF849 family)